MVEINYKKLRNELIQVYEGYLKDSKNQEIKEKAQSLYSGYRSAQPLMDKTFCTAINNLIHIGLDLKPIPSKKDIKKIIRALKRSAV